MMESGPAETTYGCLDDAKPTKVWSATSEWSAFVCEHGVSIDM
jgi:hypothetical protein